MGNLAKKWRNKIRYSHWVAQKHWSIQFLLGDKFRHITCHCLVRMNRRMWTFPMISQILQKANEPVQSIDPIQSSNSNLSLSYHCVDFCIQALRKWLCEWLPILLWSKQSMQYNNRRWFFWFLRSPREIFCICKLRRNWYFMLFWVRISCVCAVIDKGIWKSKRNFERAESRYEWKRHLEIGTLIRSNLFWERRW